MSLSVDTAWRASINTAASDDADDMFQTPLPMAASPLRTSTTQLHQLDQRLMDFEEHCSTQLDKAVTTIVHDMSTEFQAHEQHLMLMQEQLDKAHQQHAQQLAEMYRRLARTEVRASQHAALLKEHRQGSAQQVQALAAEISRLRRELHVLQLPWPARLLHSLQSSLTCCRPLTAPVAAPVLPAADEQGKVTVCRGIGGVGSPRDSSSVGQTVDSQAAKPCASIEMNTCKQAAAAVAPANEDAHKENGTLCIARLDQPSMQQRLSVQTPQLGRIGVLQQRVQAGAAAADVLDSTEAADTVPLLAAAAEQLLHAADDQGSEDRTLQQISGWPASQ